MQRFSGETAPALNSWDPAVFAAFYPRRRGRCSVVVTPLRCVCGRAALPSSRRRGPAATCIWYWARGAGRRRGADQGRHLSAGRVRMQVVVGVGAQVREAAQPRGTGGRGRRRVRCCRRGMQRRGGGSRGTQHDSGAASGSIQGCGIYKAFVRRRPFAVGCVISTSTHFAASALHAATTTESNKQTVQALRRTPAGEERQSRTTGTAVSKEEN